MIGMRAGNRLDILLIEDDEDIAHAVAGLLRIFHDVRVAVLVRDDGRHPGEDRRREAEDSSHQPSSVPR